MIRILQVVNNMHRAGLETSAFEVKDIAKLEENLSNKQIALAKWMAKRYFCNVSDCIKLMLTPGTRNKNKEKREIGYVDIRKMCYV